MNSPQLDSVEKQAAGKKSTLVSVAVNLTLTVGQVFTGLISGSQGLIADGIHSLTDFGSSTVVNKENFVKNNFVANFHIVGNFLNL